MADFIVIGRKLIPPRHIALVERYDPSANPRFKTTRDFHGRVLLVNRDSILIEEPPQLFAETNAFRLLVIDHVGTNPAIRFRVETFLPAEDFAPAKPYATRLVWRDLDGNDQSKLLLSEPETVLAVAVRGEADPHATVGPHDPGASRRRPRNARRAQPSHP